MFHGVPPGNQALDVLYTPLPPESEASPSRNLSHHVWCWSCSRSNEAMQHCQSAKMLTLHRTAETVLNFSRVIQKSIHSPKPLIEPHSLISALLPYFTQGRPEHSTYLIPCWVNHCLVTWCFSNSATESSFPSCCLPLTYCCEPDIRSAGIKYLHDFIST